MNLGLQDIVAILNSGMLKGDIQLCWAADIYGDNDHKSICDYISLLYLPR